MADGHKSRIGGSAGAGLLSYALDKWQAPNVWVAIAAFAGLGLLLWEVASTLRHHLARRNGSERVKMTLIVLVVVGLGSLGIAGLLYLIQTQPTEAASAPPSKAQMPKVEPSVTIMDSRGSINAPYNSGIIAPNNKGTIKQEAPPPKLTRLIAPSTAQNDDRTFTTIFLVDVTPYAGTLTVTAKAPALIRRGKFVIMRDGAGTINSAYTDGIRQIISGPSGKYKIYVTTTDGSGADFDYAFGQ